MADKKHAYAIILAGGEGTRFVPYSTPEKPKQFLNVIDEKRTMIQQAYDRISRFVPGERCFVATNDRYEGLVAEQLPDIPKENVIGAGDRTRVEAHPQPRSRGRDALHACGSLYPRYGERG